MHGFIAWCGFLGAWLLVAGPLHQAALELSDERYDEEEMNRLKRDDRAVHVSRWWWLIPPVWYWKQRRRAQQHRREVMATMSREQRRTVVEYLNTATGWLFVGLGGALIAVKETWELRAAYEWADWAFWGLVVAMLVICIGVTAFRIERSRQVLGD